MNIHEIIEKIATKQLIDTEDVLSLYLRSNIEFHYVNFSFFSEEEICLESLIKSSFKEHNIDIEHYSSEVSKSTNYIVSGEDCKIIIANHIENKNNKVTLTYFCRNKDTLLINELIDNLRKLENEISENSGRENFNFLMNGIHGMYISSVMGKCKSRPLIKENYNDDVVEQYNDIIETWKNPDSRSGRLVVITGKPGSGKTYMIRSFQNELKNCKLISIPSNCAQLLSDPSLLQVLDDYNEPNSDKSIVFVIEDADSLLQKRDGYNNDLVSSILNLTDGIFASAFDIKMILTTNTKIVDFDDALIRNGRLFKHIEINELCEDKAKEFLKKNGCEDIKPESFILADLYSLVDNNKNNVIKKKDKKIGF